MLSDLEDCYRLLELKPGADLEEVKRAYHELVKVWHPDRFTGDPVLQKKAQEKLKQINLAYDRIATSENSERPNETNSTGGEREGAGEPVNTAYSGNDPEQEEASVFGTLFLRRDIQDEALISQCKTILDNWSNKIPFSPIKKLGSKTEFASATEFAAYKTTVTTQIEKRWLKDHEVPYRGQPLPSKYRPGSEIDPWKLDLPRFADFASHQYSRDLPDTCRVYDCSICNASGRITCSTCAGRGEVKCRSCDGHGFKKCWQCSGKGKIRKTKTVEKNVKCFPCSGRGFTGYGNSEQRCSRCGGRGTEFKNVMEEYDDTCDGCGGRGENRCSTCGSSGKVTCSKCKGSGEVTCPRCDGAGRIMSYASAEQTEEPTKSEHQYVPTELPQFKKKDSPVSQLEGESVFLQDEQTDIKAFGFADQLAAPVLSAEVELCRQSHEGHVLRQRIVIERCSIVEYRYQVARKDYSVFLNPRHALIEDVSGPIQKVIEEMDALAQKAFNERRYEDAYRLILRSLCMDEASEGEKKLRDQILKRLTGAYCKTGLVTWLLASLAFLFFCTTASGQYGNFGALLGLFPLLGGVYLFAHDTALRFQERSFRVVAAVLIGFLAFLSGAAININSFAWQKDNHWIDWLPFGFVTFGLIGMAIARAKERKRRVEIEKHIQEFPNAQALESYVYGLDPKNGLEVNATLAMCLLLVCLLGSVFVVSAYRTSDGPAPGSGRVVLPLDSKSSETEMGRQDRGAGKTNNDGEREKPTLTVGIGLDQSPKLTAARPDSNTSTNTAPFVALSPDLQQIVKLVQAHLSDQIIVTFINQSGKSYNAGSDVIRTLISQGVSQEVIAALLRQKND